jgi:hypothetical protein
MRLVHTEGIVGTRGVNNSLLTMRQPTVCGTL